ncbi:hypothetical protein PI23P_05972 [Polaribacter irgensii 23-P]|uniref:Lipocalin-like domain-containing protein n=1 Tax=Polaribacter irgensii 23-P TaxID=313594 RepID=A4BYI1_9FLAO|nr:hypothetical protein [Polaribacter irgensii]EAR14022.1 hypothetical protein PI23P_05972 [Polaribacter irgensii 23-P]
MKNLIYLFILTLGIISCSSDNTTEINNSDLIGEWSWTNTDGGIAAHIHETPETTGKIIHLNLIGNYEYSVTENGTKISSGIYKLIMKKSIYSGEMERFIQLPENQQYIGIVTRGIIKTYEINKLDISDNNHDGIGSGFEKIE